MKFLIKTSFIVLILILIVYFSGNYILQKVTVRAIAELKPRLEQKGIMINNLEYATVRLNSYNSFAIIDANLDFHLNKKMYGKESFHAQFNANSISIRFADFSSPSFFFTFKDFSLFIEADKTKEKRTFGKLENGYLRTRIPLYLKTPEESAKKILNELKVLFSENRTPFDLDINVDVLLGIDDKEVKVGLFTERIDSTTYLKFDDEDILSAAKIFDLDLAEKEAEIIANYPSKVPAMIKITRDAKRLAQIEKGKDNSFPEDAYRHIYWSYHLTREFGNDLAKEITDAHETAPGNTDKERAMDYHNNAAGRNYADQKLSSSQLKSKVLNSNEIIKSSNEVK